MNLVQLLLRSARWLPERPALALGATPVRSYRQMAQRVSRLSTGLKDKLGLKPGDRVGVVGLGGLGHMAVKIAAAMGAHVTVFSTSSRKQADAKRLGAQEFVLTTDPNSMQAVANRYNFILDTVSGAHDLNAYLGALRRDGTFVVVGASVEPAPIATFPLILGRRRIAGSIIGGIRQTQEMLDFCAEHNVSSDVEVIPIQDVEKAYERTVKGDVRYRFVIDMKTL